MRTTSGWTGAPATASIRRQVRLLCRMMMMPRLAAMFHARPTQLSVDSLACSRCGRSCIALHSTLIIYIPIYIGISLSAKDLATWMACFIDGTRYGESSRLVSEAVWSEITAHTVMMPAGFWSRSLFTEGGAVPELEPSVASFYGYG